MAGRKPGGPKTGGRQKGTPNKVNADLKAMILGALEKKGGVRYLAEKADSHPAAFMALVGKVLPMTIQGDPNAPLVSSITVQLVKPDGSDS